MQSQIAATSIIILSILFCSTLAQADEDVTADNFRKNFVGKNVRHLGGMDGGTNFRYAPNGTYVSDNGRFSDGGSYRIQPNGQICWKRQVIDVSGCFIYYRRGDQLRVRALNGDIGPVRISR